jgi:Fe-S cluster biosynthesis and repair protein YggX
MERKGRDLSKFQNKVHRRIFGPIHKEVKSDWKEIRTISFLSSRFYKILLS